MLGTIISVAAELGTSIWKMVVDAQTARAEEHAAILARLQGALTAMRADAASVKEEMAKRDAETEAALGK